jgi:hypothetical protein
MLICFSQHEDIFGSKSSKSLSSQHPWLVPWNRTLFWTPGIIRSLNWSDKRICDLSKNGVCTSNHWPWMKKWAKLRKRCLFSPIGFGGHSPTQINSCHRGTLLWPLRTGRFPQASSATLVGVEVFPSASWQVYANLLREHGTGTGEIRMVGPGCNVGRG